MAKYVYPAIFTPEENGTFSISFPDLEGCYTCGNDLEDGIEMAEDALSLVLCGYEDEDREIPERSSLESLNIPFGSFVNYIHCDTMDYRKISNN